MAQNMPEVFLYKGGPDNEEWDDTALIEAYDKAMGCFKDKFAKKKIIAKRNINKKGKKGSKSKWKVGDYCQAVYSKDNLLYEAEILDINEQEESCVVQFIGYENEEEVDLNSVCPSQGKNARAQQIAAAKKFIEEVQQKWAPGDVCLAMFSEDGLYYHAEILEVYHDCGYCLVKFVGYGNIEEVDLQNILPLSEELSPAYANSSVAASESKGKNHSSLDESSSTFSSGQSSESAREGSLRESSHSRIVPHERHSACPHRSLNRYRLPRFPDFIVPKSQMQSASVAVPLNVEMKDELGSMLMAWYMAGFHTGYYQGRSSRLSALESEGKSVPNMYNPHEL